ncbi:putative plant seed peroxygenase [Lupinus albus]|uniref:Putative plant seed peroxygenase n=1 Tax=Lupinus albus TaxID=3870 RepID=A0A6A4PV04_LUPAL|nr:putative plant seed peroxygenase [Lupinus albus]
MHPSLSFSLVLCFIVTNLHCFALSSTNNQDGILAQSPKAPEQSFLQKHAAFFDRNHDGIIYPKETFEGLRAIGLGVLLSTVGANFINLGLSQITRPGKAPSPLLPIEIQNIQLGKHGSDSGTYNTEGGFVSSKFEEIFSKHAKKNPNALTYDELLEFVKSNRVPKDYKGWLASYVEWKILHVAAKEKDGTLTKETIRGVYDGSLFQQLEKKNSGKKINEITFI